MIQVQNSWFPLADRNPQKFMNIYEATSADFQKATHRIFHDVNNPTSVEVSVLKKNKTFEKLNLIQLFFLLSVGVIIAAENTYICS